MDFDSKTATLRERYATAVRANQVKADPLWGQACLAFNVQIPINPCVARHLAYLQDALVDLEPSALYRCPINSLHITVLWILGARVVYSTDKRSYWQRIRPDCVSALGGVVAETANFSICFRAIVPTDTAVVAVAEDAGQMAGFRKELSRRMPIPPKTGPSPDIIHTTILRYRGPLKNPEKFEYAVRRAEMRVEMPIDRVAIREERVYPSLVSILDFEAEFRSAGDPAKSTTNDGQSHI